MCSIINGQLRRSMTKHASLERDLQTCTFKPCYVQAMQFPDSLWSPACRELAFNVSFFLLWTRWWIVLLTILTLAATGTVFLFARSLRGSKGKRRLQFISCFCFLPFPVLDRAGKYHALTADAVYGPFQGNQT